MARYIPLLVALLLALALRLLLWGRVPRTGLISDEGEYLSAASWLAEGRGFSWYQSYLWTRAPIYSLFVAAHLRLFGDALVPIYITQTILSLVNVALVYLLAQRLFGDRWRAADEQRRARRSILNLRFSIASLSALLMALYLPFALYPQLLLSETLFITLLLGGFLALAIWLDQGRQAQGWMGSNLAFGPWSLVLAGGLFGLATLTRSLMLAFLPLAALWLAAAGRSAAGNAWRLTRAGILSGATFLACAGAVILPWTIYNSLPRLYGGLVVVDTSGAYNLMLGARAAYDGKREDAPARNFMLALLSKNLDQDARRQLLEPQPASNDRVLGRACLLARDDPRLLAALGRPAEQITQAERQQLITAEGLCLIGAKPLAFVQKSLAELADLFQINYTGAERFANGFAVGRLPRWYALSLFLLDDTIYVFVLPLAVIGWALARRLSASHGPPATDNVTDDRVIGRRWSAIGGLIGLWWLYNIAVAPLLFAINRFRLPLLPFAFMFAAYALSALPGGGWRALRSRYGAACLALAALLGLIAATPYAYLEPRSNGQDSRWASYLGPYPSSIVATGIAWQSRPGYLIEQQVMTALGNGDSAAARALLERGDATSSTLRIARPLLAGLEGRAEAGLKLAPALETIVQTGDVEAAVIRADLLRRLGDWQAARLILTQRFVDDANPVQWAWDWLHPPPLPNNQLDLAGNLDLGYIEGCYLGEGDTTLKPAANFRWCTDGARLRFPSAGSGSSQILALRADGRGWFDGLRPAPKVHVFVGGQAAGAFTPDSRGVAEFSVTLPPVPAGADVVVTLHMETFIPGADRYLSQQGKPVVGQVQRLGVRLDWAELREAAL
jgi:4-amino-4-deoxy-L-arabinose transferase-like glycosyltransferase